MGKSENEVIIRWDEEDGRAIVYSASAVFTRKMDRLVASGNATIKRDNEWYVDKKMVSVRPRRKSNMTDEQKKAASERMRKSILRSVGKTYTGSCDT